MEPIIIYILRYATENMFLILAHKQRIEESEWGAVRGSTKPIEKLASRERIAKIQLGGVDYKIFSNWLRASQLMQHSVTLFFSFFFS